MAEQGGAAGETPGTDPPAPAPAPALAADAAGQRSLPTPFLTKTYQLVDDPAVDDVISWNEDGSTFVVWRPAELARDLLPKYFKHNNFSSFVRQLNTYGFRKMVPDRWEFANDFFRRGEKRLLCDIHRRKVAPAPGTPVAGLATAAAAAASGAVTVAAAPIPMALPVSRLASPALSTDEQVLSSNSGSAEDHPQAAASGSAGASASGDTGEENERLRRENARLTRELGQMKKLCNNILLLMTKYASSQQLDASAALSSVVNCSGESSEAAPALAPLPPAILDLMPACPGLATAAAGLVADADPDQAARLFGVSIGLKRMRDDDDTGEEQVDHGAGAEVKTEASDPQQQQLPSSSEEPSPDQHPWPIYRPTPVYHSIRPCNGPDQGAGSDQDGSNSRAYIGLSSVNCDQISSVRQYIQRDKYSAFP